MTGTQLTGEAALDAELSLPQYAAMADEDASVAVMEKTVVVRQPVPAATLRKTLAKLGRWGGLQRVANNFESPDPPYQQARTIIDLITAGDAIDLDEPAIAAGTPELIQHGLLNAADVSVIGALASVTVRWVDANGIGEVGIGAVINSRRRIAGGG